MKIVPERHALRPSFALAVVIGLVATLVVAGPLNPPAGPVASTYKTLAEVEPRIAVNATNTPGDATSLYKIAQPGSYYLTGNITGVVGKHGIAIASSGVTLDLNGFDLVGIPAMGNFDGVSVTVTGLTNIAVVNGSVRNWGGDGVDLGISLAMFNGRVEGVLASGNSARGISVGFNCTVSKCSAYQNTSNGINTGSGGAVSNCSANQNAINGISTGSGSAVSKCTSYENVSNGINTSSGSTVSNCATYQNTGNGINTGTGCTVSNCSAYDNASNGIKADSGCTVEGCTARINTFDGIQCFVQCVIRGNNCSNNGSGDGAGIHTTGFDNRIEENICTGADRGIDVDSTGSIIIKNSCSGNGIDWTIAANNTFGPILDRRGQGGAAVSGFSAPTNLNTLDPHANFSY